MKNIKNSLKVKYIDIKLLNPEPNNPREASQKQEEDLTTGIKKFGFVDPIIVNSAPKRKNIIIGGHLRYKIAQKLKIKTIPVVYLNIPDIKKEKELNLRLNKNTGEWDFELLKNFDVNFLVNIGFDDQELSNIWDNNIELEEDNFDTEKSVQKHADPQTKPGDLIKLGSHYLLCADATNPENIKKLMSGRKTNIVYCDPPYNISLDYSKGIGTKSKYGKVKINDNKSEEEYKNFINHSIINAKSVCAESAHFFYWCDERYIGLLQSLYNHNNIKNKRVCLWIKNNLNPTPQIAFNKVYEACVYGTIGQPYLNNQITNLNEILNKNISTGNRLTDDILDLLSIWLVKRKSGQDYLHPTEKPITLHEKPFRRCTKPGDVVLDLFAGSGSTLIACEQMKRQSFLMDIEPVFCDVIIERFKNFTGLEAVYVK